VSIRPAGGIEAARVLITEDSLKIADRLKKRLFAFSFKQLQDSIGFPLTYSMLQSALVGDLLFKPDGKDKVRDDDEFLTLLQKKGKISIQTLLNKEIGKVELVKAHEEHTDKHLNAEYSDFVSAGANMFAQKLSIEMSFPNKADSASKENYVPYIINIEQSKIEAGPEPQKMPFDISEKYELFNRFPSLD
jgi:hypothetical protein